MRIECMRKGFFINGEWVVAESREEIEVHSPIDDDLLGKVPIAQTEDIEKAVESATVVQDKWANTHLTKRAELSYRIADVVSKEFDSIVQLIVREQGKPLSDAKIEVQGCIDYFKGAAEDIKRLETSVIPSIDPNKRVITIREPLGICAIITPWNFPWDIPCFILAPALAAGNTVVFKPAEQTPLCGAKIIECIEKAGMPKGVVNLVQGPGDPTGNALVKDERVDAVIFTGSTETGRKIASTGGKTLKHLLFELGGNGPIIVLEDADLKLSAEAVAFSCFMNAGQVCNAGERIIVSEEIRDDFSKMLVQIAKNVRLGNPLLSETTMGPLTGKEVLAKVEEHVEDAVSKGAEILTGGKPAQGFPTGLYYLPTVMEQVTPDMRISKEETFGPVCPIISGSSFDEMIKIANSTEYGLMSSVFTKNTRTAFYFAENIKTGTVAVNTPSNYWEGRLPWGGMKKSGMGRQGGMYSLREMTQLKTIIFDISQ
jgi:succinate-semialdehyde dehydrogenase/glutarate-semialdehyde dehydrogenase